LFVSPAQVNYEVPPGVALGTAAVTVSINGDPVASGTAQVAAVAPGIFTADGDGQGAPAAIVFTRHADGSTGFVYTYQCPPSGGCTELPIDLGLDTDQVALELYGTGIRGHSGAVTCKIGSTTLSTLYAGPQLVFPGLDQVNVLLPNSLRGSGKVTVLLTADGQTANPVSLNFK
jgi:uncharacterized protein (TIGR03437 family)